MNKGTGSLTALQCCLYSTPSLHGMSPASEQHSFPPSLAFVAVILNSQLPMQAKGFSLLFFGSPHRHCMSGMSLHESAPPHPLDCCHARLSLIFWSHLSLLEEWFSSLVARYESGGKRLTDRWYLSIRLKLHRMLQKHLKSQPVTSSSSGVRLPDSLGIQNARFFFGSARFLMGKVGLTVQITRLKLKS